MSIALLIVAVLILVPFTLLLVDLFSAAKPARGSDA